MRILLFSIIILTSCPVFSQDTTRIFYSSGKLAALQVKPDSSHIWERAFYESGKISGETIAIIKDGKNIITAFKEYFESGAPMVLINDTAELRYNQDGSIYKRSELKDHRKNGLSQTYLAGKLWLETTYKDNNKDGWMIDYDSSGQIDSRTYYRNDKQEGPTKFYKKGLLAKTIEYNNGCPVKVTYHNKTGNPTNIITDKKEIWLREGKPIGCL
jgi:antitoxin component YwqK of YwqJK toxin-antitoxin module